jgi:thiosulfate/3-mercaptopyruvate sulfurtransferase
MNTFQKFGKWTGATVATAVVAVALAGQAWAGFQPLVDVAWVKDNIGKPDVVFLDARAQVDYLRSHIPGAVNTDYGKDGWRADNKEGVRGMFPEDPAPLVKKIGDLGIDANTHVVLVVGGSSSSDMGTATRIYWTFKVLGDDNVSILDGGMAAYLKEVDKDKKPVNPLDKGPVTAQAKTFKMALRQDMLIDRSQVQAAVNSGKVTLVDNRESDAYLGITKPGPVKEAGTIPGAKNVPDSWLTVNDGGTFRSKDEIEKLYAAAGVDTTGATINFCNTGHLASVGWFVESQILGNDQAKLYDGSMTDWTGAKMPVEQKVKLK